MEGESGAFRLYFLAQTGCVKGGSDLKCLHASFWGKKKQNIELYEYQKGHSFVCLFVFMAVLLPETQTEIPTQRCVPPLTLRTLSMITD